MPKFTVGIDVSRQEFNTLLVSVEAATLKEAQEKAYKKVQHLPKARLGEICSTIKDDWEADLAYAEVEGVSSENFTEGYAVEHDLED